MTTDAKPAGGSSRASFGGQSFDRRWRIKVLFHECGSPRAGPPGCLQYLSGLTGQIRTFNFVRTDGNVIIGVIEVIKVKMCLSVLVGTSGRSRVQHLRAEGGRLLSAEVEPVAGRALVQDLKSYREDCVGDRAKYSA